MKGLIMSKKNKFDYKNLKINEENLAITKIGEMPNEEKNPLFLLLVFGIFLIFVFFLPNIVNYTLSFRITNKGDSRFYFNTKNYFIELYNEYNTLLERVIMEKDSISKDSSKDFSYDIASNTALNASRIIFVIKDEEDYPIVNLTTNDSGEEVLTCSKNGEVITYSFKNDNLINITDVLNYSKTSSDLTYQNDLALWQSRVATYNNIDGISSSFVESANGFVVNTVVDVVNAKVSSANNDYYYSSDTEAKVVNFEMEARGFSCN
jgi:hypothetical protein